MLVAIAHANGVNDTGNIHFPFVTEERELDEKGVRNKLRGLPVDVKALVRACNPYRNGGDQDLWGLGALANIDKHNMLIPYGPVGAGTNFIGIQVLGGTLVGGNVGDLLEGVTFCKLYGAGTLSHGIIEISADVSFGRTVEIFAFQEAVPVLEKLIQLVESIVETFAAHCFGK